jgi:NADPH:quinone reductase-like Zn-dependent oxidoreductase
MIQDMKALLLNSFSGPQGLGIAELDDPEPGPGQVLIKVAAAAVNPSDLSFLAGTYGIKKELPVTGGLTGSGTVVQAGSGFMPGFLMGKRVSFAAAGGAWAEYAIAQASQCIPLKKNITFEQGANLIVNPLTVLAFLEIARQRRSRAIVHTAAASALGLMLEREARSRNVQVINIVRRQEQVKLLQKDGATHVLNSSTDDFASNLKELSRKLDARLAFDAVAGETAGILMSCLPAHSSIVVYGALSGEACRIQPGDLYFKGSILEGFWLSAWVSSLSMLRALGLAREAQARLGTTLATEVAQKVNLASAKAAIENYQSNMTGSKVLIAPND